MIKLVVKVIKKCKMTIKNYKIIIYLKMITRKFNKYTEYKNKKYKKLKVNIWKNVTLSSIPKKKMLEVIK